MTIHRIEQRVCRLERQNQLLKIGLAVLGIAVVLAAANPSEPDVVRGSRFELVDTTGVVRSQFAHGGGGFALHGGCPINDRAGGHATSSNRYSVSFLDSCSSPMMKVPQSPT